MECLSVLTCLVTFFAVCSATNIPQRTGKQVAAQQPPSPANENLTGRLDSLEITQATLMREVDHIKLYQQNTVQRTPSKEQNIEDLELSDAGMKELLEQTLAQNTEMMKLLANYERFFGALYAETPESFDPNVSVDKRMSSLNSYLGNREAELLSLRPQPSTIVQNDTVDAELLGTVLYELDEQKNNMDEKLRHLEEKVGRIENNMPMHANGQSNRNADTSIDLTVDDSQQDTGQHKNCRSKRSSLDNDTQATIDEFGRRLERVENLIVTHIFPIINGTVSVWSKLAAGYDPSLFDPTIGPFINGSRMLLLKILQEEIEMMKNSQPDSKQVAFSAARTTPYMGKAVPEAIEFDHVFVNKGHHFIENTTFLCEITGYYFITFTVRSFDGYVLGIVLMKNEDTITSIYTDAHNRNVMESQSIIIHMIKGDRLWLRHPASVRFAIHSDENKYTTFSGFLIYKGE